MMIKLDDLLGRIDNLPPMPSVALELMEATNDPEVDMSKIAALVSKDPGLTAMLLKLCNSSFYGFQKEVSSIKQATSLFGMKKITQLALTVLSSRYLTGTTEGYDLSSGELWKHSIIAATAAEKLALKTGYRDAGTAFTAGLLHDIGKIIIHDHVGGALEQIRREAETDDTGFLKAEEMVLGFNHAQAGALLMERWNFPAILVDAIRNHHDAPSAKVDTTLAAITQTADALTMIMGMGIGADGLCYSVPDEVINQLGLNNSRDMESIIQTIAEKFSEDPDALLPPKAH